MYRYIAFIWDPENVRAAQAASHFRSQIDSTPRWRRQLEVPGVTICDYAEQPSGLTRYTLKRGGGMILGRLFARRGPQGNSTHVTSIEESDSEGIICTRGRLMLETYWGAYVAVLCDRRRNSVYVIRDCSGSVPCYRMEAGGVDIIFSDLKDLQALSLPSFSVNWRYLAAFIYHSQLQIRQSGLNEVTELLAGDRFTVTGSVRTQDVLWSPTHFCDPDHSVEGSEAADRLRTTTQECVGTWGSAYKGIVLGLSGGFDSSVVLGCLSHAHIRPTIHCLNRFSEEWAGDERHFARIAAARARVELIEIPWSTSASRIDDALLATQQIAKPHVPGLLGYLDVHVRGEVTRRVAAEAYWTGEGGDHIFFQMRSALGLADYLNRHGFGKHLFQVVGDSARLANMSYWQTLYNGLTQAFSRSARGPDVTTKGGGFLVSEALRDVPDEYVRHPWLSSAMGLPKGKLFQIHHLAAVLNRERPVTGATAIHTQHPLLSQPLLELCLQIPIYLLVQGGEPRGLARVSFADIVPKEIIERRTKGSTTMQTLDLLRNNRNYIASVLLQGSLVREGILSASAMEPYVTHKRPIRSEQLFPLLSALTAEMWVRSRSVTPERAAAA